MRLGWFCSAQAEEERPILPPGIARLPFIGGVIRVCRSAGEKI